MLSAKKDPPASLKRSSGFRPIQLLRVPWRSVAGAIAVGVLTAGTVHAAAVVPTDIQQPGNQPGEVNALETPDKCDNCHGPRNKGVELAHEWRGSMMAQAGRDPIILGDRGGGRAGLRRVWRPLHPLS
jgi:hypothetical protein